MMRCLKLSIVSIQKLEQSLNKVDDVITERLRCVIGLCMVRTPKIC